MTVLMADRQKPSTKVATTVKKALSSPNVRAVADPENGDISPIDKKRNKLGYHRTAVACGHCRRRKIRCIPSADTNATRCQNCIRLKKDCQFFPVDQNAATQPKRNRSESKGEALVTESETSVSSSSPGIHTGMSSMDRFDHFRGTVETTTIGQGPDQEYQQPYDHRQWYSAEQPQHSYWLQHEHNHPNSFAPSPYPMTPTTNGHPVTSQDHAYSYPAISLGHSTYPYPNHRPRDGPLTSSTGPPSAFGEFRANTMPERLGMSDEGPRAHEMHPATIGVSSQQMLGGQFPPIVGSPSQYPASAAHQVWLPANSESQHHPSNYIPQSAPPPWYGQSAGLNNMREDDSMHAQVHDHTSQSANRFRPKPG